MVTLVPVSGLDDSQRALFTGYVEVYAASGRALFGEEHTAWGADELREMERSPNRRTLAVAAVTTSGAPQVRWPYTVSYRRRTA